MEEDMTITKQETLLPAVSIPKLDDLDLFFPKEYEVLARQAFMLLSISESLAEQHTETLRYLTLESKVALSIRETQLWNTILVNAQTDKARLGSDERRKQMLADLKNTDKEYQRLLRLNVEASCQLKQIEFAKFRFDKLVDLTEQSMKARDHSSYIDCRDLKESSAGQPALNII